MQTNDEIRMRGTVIKVPGSTPGLILVNGQQKTFLLENVWLSPVAPMANMTVEVSTDASGSIAAMTVVDASSWPGKSLNNSAAWPRRMAKRRRARPRREC